MALRLRLRGPGGKQHTSTLPAAAVVGELQREAAMRFSLPESDLELLLGFPPVVCTANSSALLNDFAKDGDTIIVRHGTGYPASQAMSVEAFSRKSRLAVRQPAISAPPPVRQVTSVSQAKVNLFWKVAMDDVPNLEPAKLPDHCGRLEEVRAPYVCLHFFGGRDEAKAAAKVGLPPTEFRRIHLALAARVGEKVRLFAHSICIHPEVVFAIVSLPRDLLHHQGPDISTPIMKLRVRRGAPGDVAREVLANGTGIDWIHLPEPVSLSGTIQLETAAPLHPGQFFREMRLATEEQGRWVLVKKHSTMSCAVITFPSSAVRDSVMRQCFVGAPLQIRGIALDVKPHLEKQSDATRVNVPEALFVGWHQVSFQHGINHGDLHSVFDQLADPWMTNTPGLAESERLSDALLRSKIGSASVLGEGEVTGLGDILVLRLTRMARSAEVTAIFLGSPILEYCRLRMTAAGHDIMPPWAGGAKLLVPLDQGLVEEANVVLQHFHIVAYSTDVEKLKQALSAMPCRERPKLVQEHTLLLDQQEPEEDPFFVECTLRTDSSLGPMSSVGL